MDIKETKYYRRTPCGGARRRCASVPLTLVLGGSCLDIEEHVFSF
jgi:hypothetical protein